MRLEGLSIRNLRNLRSVDLSPGTRLNVLSGDNGQGKTNLIEAIYIAATSRSFRTSQLKDVIARGDKEGSARLTVAGDGPPYTQSVGLRGGTRVLRIGGEKPHSLVEFAARTPVVAFSPTEITISMGPGKERRKLLDRVALYTSPAQAASAMRYARALKSRQKALDGRGARASDLDVWEEMLVRTGLETMAQRRAASERLAGAARAAFATIGPGDLSLEVTYLPSAPDDPLAYASLLRSARDLDARRGSCSVGPHKDDLALALGGVLVRGYASQGQHRAVVLALKAAELSVVSEARALRPILLLDDVSSELDRSRVLSLLGFLEKQEGQVFVTTTRPELIESSRSDRVDFRVHSGEITRC